MTNSQLIEQAYWLSGVLARNVTLEAEQAQAGLKMLNDLLLEWQDDQIDVGYFEQSSVTATSTIESKAMRAVKHNLAAAICASHGVPVPEGVARIAFDSHARLRREAVKAQKSEADLSNLPASEAALATFNIQRG